MSGLPPGITPAAEWRKKNSVPGGDSLPPGITPVEDWHKAQTPDANPHPSPQSTATAFPGDFADAAKATGIDENLMLAVHPIEDASENPGAVSRSGAVGEMQMMPDTFKENSDPGWNIDNPRDNIMASARYLKKLVAKYGMNNTRQIFAAYNAGPGGNWNDKGVQAYVNQAEANYEALTRSLKPPKPTASPLPVPTPRLSLGAPPVSDSVAGQAMSSGQETDTSFLGRIDDAAEAAAKAVPWAAGQTVKTALGINDKQAEQAMSYVVAHPEIGATANFVSNIANIPIETINAAMRDSALMDTGGKPTHLAQLGSAIIGGLIQNPRALGDVLDREAQHYGENSAEEISFWSEPGLRDALAKAQPRTAEGRYRQQLALMHADVARGLLTHQGIRDLMTGTVELANPGNDIPGVLEMKVARPLTKLGAKGMAKAIDKTPWRAQVDQFNDWAKRSMDALHTTMPFGDRFHMSQVQAEDMARKAGKKAKDVAEAGVNAAGWHHHVAQEIALAPERASRVLGQEDKLGNTSIVDAKKIHRYHDKFYNVHETAHVFQPQGGDPVFDPLTRTTVMQRGAPDTTDYAEHQQYVFVTHPATTRLEIPDSTMGVARVALAPDDAEKWSLLIGQGKLSEALQLHKNIGAEEADTFEQAIRANPMGDGKSKLSREWIENQMNLRLISEHLSSSAMPAANWGEQVVFNQAQRAERRDLTDIHGTSVDQRAFNIATAMNSVFDGPLRRMVPSDAANFIEGYWPRSGMYKEEPTAADMLALDRTAKAHAAQSSVRPATLPRKAYSIRDAEGEAPFGFGLKENDNFDPRAALFTSAVRSLRYQYYVQALRDKMEGINYKEAYEASGLTFAENPIWSPSEESEIDLSSGPEGRKILDEAVSQEAQTRLKNSLSKGEYDALSDPHSKPKLDDMLKRMKKNIYEQIQGAWEARHPGMTWRTEETTGVQDMFGYTVPKWVANAAIDSHPAFDTTGKANLASILLHEDSPESSFQYGIESMLHMMRSVFLADPTYHQRQNLSFIGAAVGHLNAMELALVFFAPNLLHKMFPDMAENAEKGGALAASYGHGVGGPRSKARYGFAAAYKPTDNNIFRRNTYGLPQRMRDTIEAYKRSVEGSKNPVNVAQHVLGRAFYQGDKWNQDLTFKVWEDTTAAMIHRKLTMGGVSGGKFGGMIGQPLRKKMDIYAAGRQVRKAMGDSQNMTRLERQIGLQKVEWFYSWLKGQYRLWSENFLNKRVVGYNSAIHQTLQSHNENDPNAPNPQTMADRGQAIFYGFNGEPYIITLAPPPTRKLNAITSLASTPFTEDFGAMDFMQFTVSDMAHSLNPVMKTTFETMPATFGAENARTTNPGEVLGGALQGAGTMMVPPQAAAIKHGMSDPTRYLELLGVPVVNVWDRQSAGAYTAAMDKLIKQRSSLLSRATSEADKAEIQETFNPMIDQLLRQQQQAYGR